MKLSKEFGSVWLIKENSVSFFIVTNVNTEWTFFQHRHGNFYRVQTLCIQSYSMPTIWWSQQQTNKQQLRQQQRWWQSPENTEERELRKCFHHHHKWIKFHPTKLHICLMYVWWISIIENSFKQTQPKMLKLIFNSSKAKKKEKCEMWWYFPLMIQKVNNNAVLLSSGSNLTLFRFDSLFCLFVWMNVCYVCENNKTNTHTEWQWTKKSFISLWKTKTRFLFQVLISVMILVCMVWHTDDILNLFIFLVIFISNQNKTSMHKDDDRNIYVTCELLLFYSAFTSS